MKITQRSSVIPTLGRNLGLCHRLRFLALRLLFLVVVNESDQHRYRRARKAYAALRGITFPADVIVMTCEEAKRKMNVQRSLVSRTVHEGKLLYRSWTAAYLVACPTSKPDFGFSGI